ncbi:uncharacterized protein At4g06598-like [Wolffia australiana]
MANTRAAPSFRSMGVSGKQSFLPPKSPLPGVSHHGDGGSKNLPRTREGNIHHQRTSSASFLIEEQPSWLDDLLNEPETPVKRGSHRRSSSDSSAYLDLSNVYLENIGQDEQETSNFAPVPSWGPRQLHKPSNVVEWQYGLGEMNYHGGNISAKEKFLAQSLRSRGAFNDADSVTSSRNFKNGGEESGSLDCEKNDGSNASSFSPELDPKRAKQKFAQRSRVRKLQYIAELERTVQAMQASDFEARVFSKMNEENCGNICSIEELRGCGPLQILCFPLQGELSDVAAEVGFLDQQNIILSFENEALKRRLDSLTQEKLLKCVQQETLEREISRLRAMYQQQHRHQAHGPTGVRELDSLFGNLSLKQRSPVLDGNK